MEGIPAEQRSANHRLSDSTRGFHVSPGNPSGGRLSHTNLHYSENSIWPQPSDESKICSLVDIIDCLQRHYLYTTSRQVLRVDTNVYAYLLVALSSLMR